MNINMKQLWDFSLGIIKDKELKELESITKKYLNEIIINDQEYYHIKKSLKLQ